MNEKTPRPVKLYFDGGCRPNPGAMESGVVIRGVTDIRRDLGQGDNSEAEWLALLHALDIAASQGERDVILIGDSLSVIRQANRTLPCPADWRARFDASCRRFDRVRFRHVKRTQNLAGIALEKARWSSGAV